MNRLVDKVAVITGAGSGIGRAAAKMFVAEGAKVVVAEIDETLGEASAREAGARFVRTDVTDEKSVMQMVRQARDAFGRIDVLLNCAGGSVREDRPVSEVDLSVWDHTINLDMKGPFLCCRHVIPVMVEQGKGSVVNFSSVVALRGNHIRFGGIDNMAERYPFSVGQPEDIANVALFLASDESRMVNGAAIPAEGGFSAY